MDNDDSDSKKSEPQYLGKLEYSIDYDFQKQEVMMSYFIQCLFTLETFSLVT